jgi:hypothetical protein
VSNTPTARRSGRLLDNDVMAGHHPDRHWAHTNREPGSRGIEVIGLLALASSVLYFGSDVIEVLQGGFSTGQLWLTFVAEATLPVFILGLWLLQRPRIGRLGGLSAIAYAYSFVFFTATVAYALVNGTRDFEQLGEELSPAMPIHGAVMVLAGVGFGYAVSRAGVLPRWTGMALAIGVALIPLSSLVVADAVGLIAVGLRDLAFAGMGAALLLRGRRGSNPGPEAGSSRGRPIARLGGQAR